MKTVLKRIETLRNEFRRERNRKMILFSDDFLMASRKFNDLQLYNNWFSDEFRKSQDVDECNFYAVLYDQLKEMLNENS